MFQAQWFLVHIGAISLIATPFMLGCDAGSNEATSTSTANTGGAAGQGGGVGQGGQGAGATGQGGQGGSSVSTEVAMFIAQGHAGRTIVSCDDGKTWVANRSDDDALICFSGGADCDHHPGAARGITYGNGYFVVTFGWGKPGSIRRTRNGTDWENRLEGKTFAGVVFGNGVFLAGERPPQVSTDDGATWTPGGSPMSDQWNVRRTGFAAHEGGRFFLAFGSSGNDLNVSADQGASWKRPSVLPAECAADIQWDGGFAYGNGKTLVLGGTGVACSSADGGETWVASTNIGGTVNARLSWDGESFVTWGRADNGQGGTYPARFTTKDGETWTATATEVRTKNPDGTMQTSPGPSLGAVARSDTGTYVAVNGGWQQWYEKQRFYRSTDGITWDTLETGTYVGSHPIQFIAYGMGQRGGACP